MTIVDILLSPARASDIAMGNFKTAYDKILAAFEELFNPEVPDIKARGGALMGAIGAAESMGNEAALEPRYWRHDWPTAKYEKGIACLKTLRFCLDSIESVMVLDDGMKKPLFIEMINMPEFKVLKDTLMLHVQKVMETVEKSIQDFPPDGVTSYDVFLEKARLKGIKSDCLTARKTFDVVWRDALGLEKDDMGNEKGFCKALNSRKFAVPAPADKSMFSLDFLAQQQAETPSQDKGDISKDSLAECCLLVESLRAMFADLDATLEAVVS
jgi:hypothetical protein